MTATTVTGAIRRQHRDRLGGDRLCRWALLFATLSPLPASAYMIEWANELSSVWSHSTSVGSAAGTHSTSVTASSHEYGLRIDADLDLLVFGGEADSYLGYGYRYEVNRSFYIRKTRNDEAPTAELSLIIGGPVSYQATPLWYEGRPHDYANSWADTLVRLDSTGNTILHVFDGVSSDHGGPIAALDSSHLAVNQRYTLSHYIYQGVIRRFDGKSARHGAVSSNTWATIKLVPEPASIGLMLVGVAGALIALRRTGRGVARTATPFDPTG